MSGKRSEDTPHVATESIESISDAFVDCVSAVHGSNQQGKGASQRERHRKRLLERWSCTSCTDRFDDRQAYCRTPSHDRCSHSHGLHRQSELYSEATDGFGVWKHESQDLDAGKCAAWLTASGLMAIYYRTLSPSIAGGDSGEVMAAACSWGPAHPPGYPLFVALAQLAMTAFSQLGGNKAFRVNLMCALLTASAVFHLHRAARIVTNSRCERQPHQRENNVDEYFSVLKLIHFWPVYSASATLAASMYGLSPLIWNNALQASSSPLALFLASVTIQGSAKIVAPAIAPVQAA
jgi:hypothetical protein